MSGTLTLDGTPPLIVPGGASGDVLTLDSSGNVTPAAPSGGGGGVTLDSAGTDIKPLGSAAEAGSSADAARADHVHSTAGVQTAVIGTSVPQPLGAGAAGGSGELADFAHTHPSSSATAFVSGAVTLTYASTVTLDASQGNHFRLPLAGDAVIATPLNPGDGEKITVVPIQDSSGSRTLSWSSAFAFPGGTAPVLSTAGGARDIIAFVYDEPMGLWYFAGAITGFSGAITRDPYVAATYQVAAGASSATFPTSAATISGDTIVFIISLNTPSTSSEPSSISDGTANSYSQSVADTNDSTGEPTYAWACLDAAVVASGTNVTIDFTGTTGAKNIVMVGIPGATSGDQAVATHGSTMDPSITSAGLASSTETGLAAVSNQSAGGAVDWTSGWTPLAALSESQYTGVAYQILTSTAAVTASGALTSSVHATTLLLTFET